MAGVISGIIVENVGDITPGTIFIGYSTLPSHSQPKRRPFLALWKVGNQVVSLPLTSLQNEGYCARTAAERFGRSLASYYPIAPASNPSYLPVNATDNFQGFIDLLTPVTIGQSSLGRKSRAVRISARDLRSVIMAHVGLVQCGLEAVQTGQEEQESEVLLMDRETHDGIRQMALDMLQRSEEGLLHARRTQEVTRSLVEAFDRPPAARLILPRLPNPTPPLSSFVDPAPPPPPPGPPQADTQHRQPGQQQPQQHLNSQYAPAGCRPGTSPGGPRNPDDGGGGGGPSGTRGHQGPSNSYAAPTGTGPSQQRARGGNRRSGSGGNQGMQHQNEYQREEYPHNEDSNNKEEEIDEWTKDDWEWVEKRPGEDSDSISSFSVWEFADWDELEGRIENTPTQKCGQCHTTTTASPGEVYQTPTCQSTASLSEGDQSDRNSELPKGKTVTPSPLLNPPLQEGQEEPPSKDTGDEHDRRCSESSPDRHQQHQRNFLPVSQSQWAQSQFATFTRALRRITPRSQLQQEATSVPPAGRTSGEGGDTHTSGISPQGVAITQPTTQATKTGPEQAPTDEPKIAEPETSPILPVRPTEQEDARDEQTALLESPPRSAPAGEEGEKGEEENEQKVVEEEYKKVYRELQRILSNACKSWLRPLGVSEDSLRALQPEDEVSFGAYRSSFSSLISEDSAHEDDSTGRFLAALDRGQSLQAEIAAEMAAGGGRLSGGLLMEYAGVAREICQPHDDSSREIDELCARAEIALESSSSATAAAAAESSN